MTTIRHGCDSAFDASAVFVLMVAGRFATTGFVVCCVLLYKLKMGEVFVAVKKMCPTPTISERR
jgi:hypothetical protein